MSALIYIVGSVNMDYVVEVDRLPHAGETRMGSALQLFAGGKGANQAVAAARMARYGEVEVAFAGHVGEDDAGHTLKTGLQAVGVRCDELIPVSGSSGSAMITRDASGQNTIVVSAAANFGWKMETRDTLKHDLGRAKVLLLQMEIPLTVNRQAMDWARAGGAMCVLDPAPAQALSPEALAGVDLLTPNETEACILLREPVRPIPEAEVPALAQRLLGLGVRAVLLKLGERGAYYRSGGEEIWARPFRVRAVDTTAAGDTFNGALAVALCEGKPMPEAMRFACAAAACSVMRVGAQVSIPTRDEVEALLAKGE